MKKYANMQESNLIVISRLEILNIIVVQIKLSQLYSCIDKTGTLPQHLIRACWYLFARSFVVMTPIDS